MASQPPGDLGDVPRSPSRWQDPSLQAARSCLQDALRHLGWGRTSPANGPCPGKSFFPLSCFWGSSLRFTGCHWHGSILAVLYPHVEEGFFSLSPLPGFIICDSGHAVAAPTPRARAVRVFQSPAMGTRALVLASHPPPGPPSQRGSPGPGPTLSRSAGQRRLLESSAPGNRQQNHSPSPSQSELPIAKCLPEVAITHPCFG